MKMRHTISALVENRSGVLSKISGLFSARGYNIDSLAVGPTEKDDVSRMTIVVNGDENVLEQVTKQLNKLPDVIRVRDFKDMEIVERDLMLIRVRIEISQRPELMEIANIFRAKIVDVGTKTVMIEVTGDENKIEAFIELMRAYRIVEMARTGVIALERGGK